jgi:hypothetical protein
MAIGLYDVSALSFLQVLGAVEGFLEKGRKHCAEKGVDLASIVETRLYPDMLPFSFQCVSVAHHSLGALQGAQAGLFKPPSPPPGLDYAGLQKLIADARAGVQGFSREAVNAMEGKDVVFEIGGRKMPFTAEGFLMSFSLPNFYFHAATAYDILRMKGVPLGKRDFMGQMRMKT